MKLPLTKHESSLINQIQDEIQEMSDKFNESIANAEKETDPAKQKEAFKNAYDFSKQIRERSKTRELIIKDAFNRCFK